MISTRSILCFSVFFSLVSAQSTDASGLGSHFQPDPLSIWNSGHRAPFLALFAASLFNAIYNFIEIAYFVSWNTLPGSTGELDVLVTTETFFNYWSYALLHVALALVLYDRHKSNMRGELGKYGRTAFNALFVLLVALMVSATVSAAFYATELLTNAEQERAFYTFMCIWGVAALCVAFACVEIFKRMRRAGVRDRITKTVRSVLAPLSVFSAGAGLVLTFYEPVLYADLVLNVLYAYMTSVLIHMGLRPGYWNAPLLGDIVVTPDPNVMVQTETDSYTHRNGDFDEMKDPLGD